MYYLLKYEQVLKNYNENNMYKQKWQYRRQELI